MSPSLVSFAPSLPVTALRPARPALPRVLYALMLDPGSKYGSMEEQIVLLALQAGTQLNRDDIRHYVTSTVDIFVQLARTGGRRQISEVVLNR